MAETRVTIDRSESPMSFQKIYDELSLSDKSLVDAMTNMAFVLLKSIHQAQTSSNEKGS